MTNSSFYRFEDIYNELKNKKLEDLTIKDIGKYLLVAEELDLADEIGDDKFFYTYDEQLLDNLSQTFSDSVFQLIHEKLEENNLHTQPSDELEY